MTKYLRCQKCGEEVLPENLNQGLCGYCSSLHCRRGSDHPGDHAHVMLTTEMSSNLNVTKRLGLVASERIYGVNIFRDMLASVRDIVGGANKSSQNVLQDARTEVLDQLKQEAHELGANAVVAVDIDYGEISGGGKSMLLVAATGTAVVLSD